MTKQKLVLKNCIAWLVVCRSLDSRNIVPFCQTGRSSEIRNNNLQVIGKQFIDD